MWIEKRYQTLGSFVIVLRSACFDGLELFWVYKLQQADGNDVYVCSG